MSIFAPALTSTLKHIVAEFGGIGDLKRNSAIETRIHNFLATHDLRDQLPAIEAWFADLSEHEREDVANLDGLGVALLSTAPAFTSTVLDQFADMVRFESEKPRFKVIVEGKKERAQWPGGIDDLPF